MISAIFAGGISLARGLGDGKDRREKKTELEDDVAKLKAKIDDAAATPAKLRKEMKELHAELAELAEMDKIRAEVNEAYLKADA